MKNLAVFCQNPFNLQDVKESYGEKYACEFQIEKVIELPKSLFHIFNKELYEDYRFLYDFRDAMYVDSVGIRHCLLITTVEMQEGILVAAEGGAYARYAAYVPNCQTLDLTGIEVLQAVYASHKFPPEYRKRDASMAKKDQEIR